MNAERIEQIFNIAENAVTNLKRLHIASDEDKAAAAEVVRQTTNNVCAFQRTGWTAVDYRFLRAVLSDLAMLKVQRGLTFQGLWPEEQEQMMAKWKKVITPSFGTMLLEGMRRGLGIQP